ncbi:hypothetical protein CLF_101822 [Clonorchis sinensis]|uniref:Uncharacterized protein n=1 Tax=Clonorchis sinensis TaxID=79923 RepID=G7Y6M9_CLOSI|nr:hypothetical protein CLF_101822 [Clonorchis sinensis]
MGEQYPVRSFVMDKLAAQMRAASVVFGCDVLLCYFHIRKAIRKHSGIVHFGNGTNNRPENANDRLKDRVHHADTLEHAIRKVSRHAEWLMREFEVHTPHHCDRRQILESDGYVLNVRWLSDYNLPEKGVPLTLIPKPPPTAFDALRKQMNRVMDKLQGLEPRKATASFKQPIVHGQILLRRGSNFATGGLPSVVEDTAFQPRWQSRDTNLGFCVLCDRPTTTSDRWCATDRTDCYDGEPCPLCGGALQACPKASGPSKKRRGVVASRSAERASYDVDPDRSAESQYSVSRKSVWLSDNNLPEKGVPLTLIPRPPPTACDALRKQMNRLMDKLQGLEPRKAKASFKQLTAHGQILLRQGSNPATGCLPSLVEDAALQPIWQSRGTNLGFCVRYGRPTTTSDRWCATDRVSYHADCYDGEPCPLCGVALQACPKASGPFKKRKGVLATRSAKRVSYDVDLDRSAASQHSVSRKSVCVRVFGSKEELLNSHGYRAGQQPSLLDLVTINERHFIDQVVMSARMRHRDNYVLTFDFTCNWARRSRTPNVDSKLLP